MTTFGPMIPFKNFGTFTNPQLKIRNPFQKDKWFNVNEFEKEAGKKALKKAVDMTLNHLVCKHVFIMLNIFVLR